MKTLLLIAAFMVGSPSLGRSQARQEVELYLANYGLSFAQQFLGKVAWGENVWKAFRETSYEAVPSATLQYAGMKLVGQDWRLALPAQVLVQKGAWFERQSMLGRPLFTREVFTSWELDYLWFNLRLRDGKLLLPRLNIMTSITSVQIERQYLNWKESLQTGAVIFTASIEQLSVGGSRAELPPGMFIGGRESDNVIRVWSIKSSELLRHESIHALQRVRGGTLPDIILRQDASQKRFLPFLRLDLGQDVALVIDRAQEILGEPEFWHSYFSEWEARAYSNSNKLPRR